jgi:hypothetical protein
LLSPQFAAMEFTPLMKRVMMATRSMTTVADQTAQPLRFVGTAYLTVMGRSLRRVMTVALLMTAPAWPIAAPRRVVMEYCVVVRSVMMATLSPLMGAMPFASWNSAVCVSGVCASVV